MTLIAASHLAPGDVLPCGAVVIRSERRSTNDRLWFVEFDRPPLTLAVYDESDLARSAFGPNLSRNRRVLFPHRLIDVQIAVQFPTRQRHIDYLTRQDGLARVMSEYAVSA